MVAVVSKPPNWLDENELVRNIDTSRNFPLPRRPSHLPDWQHWHDYRRGWRLYVLLLTATFVALLAMALTWHSAATAPIEPGAIQVIDGDTIRSRGNVYRLVGFDAPEGGSNARCEGERKKKPRKLPGLICIPSDIRLISTCN
jgi:hypothetical protein